jgi:hypothetical protein
MRGLQLLQPKRAERAPHQSSSGRLVAYVEFPGAAGRNRFQVTSFDTSNGEARRTPS